MPPHRDWTRHGVGRALLWWPFMAFVLVAAFPALAVPCVIGSGAALVLVGIVGGTIGRLQRARRLRRAGRAVGTRTISAITATPIRIDGTVTVPADDERTGDTAQETADAGDAEDDHPAHLHRRAA